jgi:hypothetical protein
MEHRVVENAIHGDRDADSERERENRGERKAGVAKNLPERKTEILKRYLHAYLPSRNEGMTRP